MKKFMNFKLVVTAVGGDWNEACFMCVHIFCNSNG